MATETRDDQLIRLLERLRMSGELGILTGAIADMADLQERELRKLLANVPARSEGDLASFAYLQGHFFGLQQVLAMLVNAATPTR